MENTHNNTDTATAGKPSDHANTPEEDSSDSDQEVTLIPQPELQTLTRPDTFLPLEERKRIILTETPKPVYDALVEWLLEHSCTVDPDVPETAEYCSLHLNPPMTGTNIIQTYVNWNQPGNGRQGLTVNFGVAVIIMARCLGREEGELTEEQLDGFINHGWHLSHLCGNWTCLNIDHYTIEPGPVNISRNSCFYQTTPCRHNPGCLRELKRPSNELRPQINHPYLEQFTARVEDQGREEEEEEEEGQGEEDGGGESEEDEDSDEEEQQQ